MTLMEGNSIVKSASSITTFSREPPTCCVQVRFLVSLWTLSDVYLFHSSSITSSQSTAPRTSNMKSAATLVLALCTACLALDQPSSDTLQPIPSSTKKPELASKRLEQQKAAEGRAIGRMEVTDAQLEMALKDKRYLQRQLKCTLGEAPCDPVGRRLRTLAPLVVRGSCPQCTPTEMRQIQKVLLHMQRNFPKEWARIVRTYQ